MPPSSRRRRCTLGLAGGSDVAGDQQSLRSCGERIARLDRRDESTELGAPGGLIWGVLRPCFRASVSGEGHGGFSGEVVTKVAEVAAHRQVIVATHNANIPVLGDAELILALDATTDKGRILACGGLDEPAVADTARKILEGGAQAFDERARRYSTGA